MRVPLCAGRICVHWHDAVACPVTVFDRKAVGDAVIKDSLDIPLQFGAYRGSSLTVTVHALDTYPCRVGRHVAVVCHILPEAVEATLVGSGQFTSTYTLTILLVYRNMAFFPTWIWNTE